MKKKVEKNPNDMIKLAYILSEPGKIVGGDKRTLYRGSPVVVPRWQADKMIFGGKFVLYSEWELLQEKLEKQTEKELKDEKEGDI